MIIGAPVLLFSILASVFPLQILTNSFITPEPMLTFILIRIAFKIMSNLSMMINQFAVLTVGKSKPLTIISSYYKII